MMETISQSKYLSKEEVNQLTKTVTLNADSDRLYGRTTWPKREMLISLALGTGMRVSEMAALQVKDIKLGHQPYIHVAGGKGDKDRDVTIGSDLKAALSEYIDKHGLTGDDFLLNVNGRQYSRMALQKQFKACAKEAGLDSNYSIHSLRHTYATHYYRVKQDLLALKEQLGHANVSTTQVYAKPSEVDKIQTLDAMYAG